MLTRVLDEHRVAISYAPIVDGQPWAVGTSVIASTTKTPDLTYLEARGPTVQIAVERLIQQLENTSCSRK